MVTQLLSVQDSIETAEDAPIEQEDEPPRAVDFDAFLNHNYRAFSNIISEFFDDQEYTKMISPLYNAYLSGHHDRRIHVGTLRPNLELHHGGRLNDRARILYQPRERLSIRLKDHTFSHRKRADKNSDLQRDCIRFYWLLRRSKIVYDCRKQNR